MNRMAFSILAFAAFAAAPVLAQQAANGVLGKHDPNAPIAVSSDNFSGDFQTKVGTYYGNVVVTQGDYKLRADTVKVAVKEGKPDRITANGNVVFDSDSGTATGDNCVYDLGPRTVTLTGNVVLTKEKNVMHGTTLVVDLNTGQAKLGAKGLPGNRVQGLFTPPKQTAPKKSTGQSSGGGN